MSRFVRAALVVAVVIGVVGCGTESAPSAAADRSTPTPTAMPAPPPSSSPGLTLPTATISGIPGPGPETPHVVPTPVIAKSALELADRQMAASATLAAFTGGVPYEIKKQGYWSNSDSSVQLGLVREITFAKPITTRMQKWPVIVWPKGTNGYQQYAYNAQYKNVTTAILNLDKAKGLVAINPGEGAITVQGPGNNWIDTLPETEGE